MRARVKYLAGIEEIGGTLDASTASVQDMAINLSCADVVVAE